MPYRALLSTFAALAVIVGASNSTRADSDPRYTIPPAATLPAMMREAHSTVLTMGPDGSWGVSIRQPIADSVAMHAYFRGSKGAAACAEWKKHIVGLIPSPDDQDRYAQWRRPTDMMVHG